MNPDFENRLQEQPWREIPSHWRARILAAAPPAPAGWRQWLWPCPQAWAGLAAAWLLILGMNLAAGKNPSQAPAATLAASRQELLELRAQQQLLARLIEPGETAEAEPPKALTSPRTERRKTVVTV